MSIARARVRQSAMSERDGHDKVVLLGTGTPRPDPERSGPATAISADGTP